MPIGDGAMNPDLLEALRKQGKQNLLTPLLAAPLGYAALRGKDNPEP